MGDPRTQDHIDREVLALVWRASETKPTSPDYGPAHSLKSWMDLTAANIAADLVLPDGVARASCERLVARGVLDVRIRRYVTRSRKQQRGNFSTPHSTKVYFLTREAFAAGAPAAKPQPSAAPPGVTDPPAPARVPWINRDAEQYASRAAQCYRTGKDSDSALLLFTNAHRALRELGVPEASAVPNAKIIADEVWENGPGPSRTGAINVEPDARRKVLAAIKRLGLESVTIYAGPKVAISQGVSRANAQGRFVVDCYEWQWRELLLANVGGIDAYRD